MSVELPLYSDDKAYPAYKDVPYAPVSFPVSFAVSPMPDQGAFLALPHEPLPHPSLGSNSRTVQISSQRHSHATALNPGSRSAMRPSSRPSLMTAPAMQPRSPVPVAQSSGDPMRERRADAAEPVLQPYPMPRYATQSATASSPSTAFPSAPSRSMPVLAPIPVASSVASSIVARPVAPNLVPAPSSVPAYDAAKPKTQDVAKTGTKSSVARSAKQRSPISLLQGITTLKWGSMAIASTLFAAAFVTYGWTVTLERRGSHLNNQLNQLRAHEKGMTGMAAAIGASMADDSQQPESGLHLPAPGSIFPLELAAPRPPVDDEDADNKTPSVQRHQPRGY